MLLTYKDQPIPILDNGYVRLIGIYGNDAHIDYSARMSFDGARKVTDIKSLIRYLVRHRHTSPLEMCEVQFELKIPLFVNQQLIRHRTANINQMSYRYTEAIEEFHLPALDDLKPQSTDNKQGRGGYLFDEEKVAKQAIMQRAYEYCLKAYRELLGDSGQELARETAREVLPAATYTKLTWKCDLHNFFHFLKLRLDPHAQYEIRVLAEAMYFLAKPHFPIAFGAFEDYILNSKHLSALDQNLLGFMMVNKTMPTWEHAERIGMAKREYSEFVVWAESLSTKSTL